MTVLAPHFIRPLTLEQFFAEYWERQPLHIARAAPQADPLIDLSSIESLLSNQALYFPGIQVTKSGSVIESVTYCDEQNRILPLRLLEHHRQGATIVLSQAQTLFPKLNALCREVIRTLKMRCQTNVYVSPPGKQGFNAHYDTHDVFILQVSGSKTFNFYPSSVELPFTEERFDASKLNEAQIDESIRLSAGDTLYIPRGVVHDAVADESESSIHITLGVYPVLMRDLLQEAVQLMAQRDVRLRKSLDTSLPASAADSSQALGSSASALMQELATAVDNPDVLQQLLARFSDELALSAQQNCEGLTLRNDDQQSQKRRFSDDVVVRIRKDMLIDVQSLPNGIKIRTFGQIIEFEKSLGKAVKQLLEAGELPMREWTEIDANQRNALIDRLLQENLVDIT